LSTIKDKYLGSIYTIYYSELHLANLLKF
jgi:hypothetical protein